MKFSHMRMHGVVERMHAGGPSCLLCSQTCTEYRDRKRLCADSCAEARRVLLSLAGPEIVEHMLRDPATILCRSCQRDLCKITLLKKQLAILTEGLRGFITQWQQRHRKRPAADLVTTSAYKHFCIQPRQLYSAGSTNLQHCCLETQVGVTSFAISSPQNSITEISHSSSRAGSREHLAGEPSLCQVSTAPSGSITPHTMSSQLGAVGEHLAGEPSLCQVSTAPSGSITPHTMSSQLGAVGEHLAGEPSPCEVSTAPSGLITLHTLSSQLGAVGEHLAGEPSPYQVSTAPSGSITPHTLSSQAVGEHQAGESSPCQVSTAPSGSITAHTLSSQAVGEHLAGEPSPLQVPTANFSPFPHASLQITSEIETGAQSLQELKVCIIQLPLSLH